MFPRLRRLDRPLRVPRVRRADVDGLDRRVVQHALVAAMRLCPTKILGELLRIGQLAGTHGRQVAGVRLLQVHGELPRDPTRGDDAPVQLFRHRKRREAAPEVTVNGPSVWEGLYAPTECADHASRGVKPLPHPNTHSRDFLVARRSPRIPLVVFPRWICPTPNTSCSSPRSSTSRSTR